MTFDINAMLQTLPIMGKGMAGIFVVAAVIVLFMYLIAKIPSQKIKKTSNTKSEKPRNLRRGFSLFV